MPFDPSNAQMYVGGTTVGGMPGSGGYMPNTTELMVGNMRMQQDARMQQLLLQNDVRAQYMARLAANAIGGRQGGAKWFAENGQFTAQVAGMAVNSQMMSGLMGGSILDMYGGVSTGLAAGGFTKINMSGGGSTMSGGAGYVNDQLSRIALMRMQDNFFNERGGAMLHKTYGMDRGQLGDLAAYMGMGGAFRGMQGTMTRVSSESDRAMQHGAAMKAGNTALAQNLQALEGADFGKEQYVFDMSKSDTDRMNRKMEAAARALGSVKDIFGDRALPDLLNIAKEVSGADITQLEGAREVVGRMQRIKAFSAMHGLSAEAVANEQAGMSRALGGGAQGAAASEIVQGYVQTAMANLVGRGGAPSRDQVAGFMLSASNALEQEKQTPVQAAALHALTTNRSLSQGQRTQLRQGLAAIENAEGTAARSLAVEALAADFGKISGMSLDDYLVRAGGLKDVKEDPRIARGLEETKQEEAQKRMRTLGRDWFKSIGGAAGDFGYSAFTGLGGDNYEQLIEAMGQAPGADNVASARKIIEGSQLTDDHKKLLSSQLDAAAKDPTSWRKLWGEGKNILNVNNLSGLIPTEMRKIESEGMLASIMAQQAFGTDYTGNPNDIMRNLVGGLMGQRTVTDDSAMAWLYGQGKTTNIAQYDPAKKKFLGANQTGLENILKQTGGKLDARFGLDQFGTVQEKAARLKGLIDQNPAVMNELMDELSVNGFKVSRSDKGTIEVAAEQGIKDFQEKAQPLLDEQNLIKALGKKVKGFKGADGDTWYKSGFGTYDSAEDYTKAQLENLLDPVFESSNARKSRVQTFIDLASSGQGDVALRAIEDWRRENDAKGGRGKMYKEYEKVDQMEAMVRKRMGQQGATEDPILSLGRQIFGVLQQIESKS